ncbi:MAG: efflux RND transporter periplasmic adaptor subunit [Arenimonas sp.]
MTAHCRPLRALLVMLSLLLAACSGPPEAPTPRPAMVTRASSGDGALEAYAGEVHAREEPTLAFRIPGKLIRRLVDAGSRVQAGQALAELDPADARLQSEASRAALASAQSGLALAQAELTRYKDLVDRQLVSRSLYEARVASLRAAQAQVRQASAESTSSGNQVGYSVLRAPAAGVISQRLAEAGQVVAAGQPVFVLAVDGEREVAISVAEQGLQRFAVGRELAVELWTQPGQLYPGSVRELSPSADPVTRTYAARVAFSAPADGVELGQSARVYARVDGDSHLRLPLSALTQREGQAAVWIVDPGTRQVHLRRISVGAYAEDGVPVLSGLRADEWVVAAGAHLMLEGEKISPIDRHNHPVALVAAAVAR